MRYSRVSCAPAGFGQTLPSVILEFFGNVNSTIRLSHPFFRFVIAGLDPAIHHSCQKRWMRGSSPRMTLELVYPRLRLAIGDVIRHRVGMYRAILDRNFACRVVE